MIENLFNGASEIGFEWAYLTDHLLQTV